MAIKYLLDENLTPDYREQLSCHQSTLKICMIGDPDAPSKGAKDPDILIWCEQNGCILVTNNRRSMPVHLAHHLAEGRHIPGILVFRPKADIGRVIEDLILIAVAALEDEYQDRIVYIPLS
ncbi:DUF5615 family PIN-like protein [Kovacikia minuta CCNUW1]|uniref:DUF5615 family PIN-like protein n=1 Tax=Kovacikia minuta TaxID=2931930 RepID=UPI001CCFF272|nr:DUF5615 family PIN-like protein [Kovacikia minuta]UBF29032.1 DUF5615 family PIN-like protein [Kovacikia minuta CCNUW1]